MPGAFEVGSLFGIRVRLHLSWLVIFFLVAWSLAGNYLPVNYPGWQPRLYWLIGLAGSVLLFISVLVHELSHSLVAISRGYKVKAITLFLLGGVSEIEREPKKASEEFLIAIAGPLASFVLGGLFVGLHQVLGPQGNPPLRALSAYLSTINIVLGLFNLIPGYPMDGGRVLRSIVWKATGSLRKATNAAANTGMLIGFLFIAFGIYMALSQDLTGGLWLAFIGWFIQSSASTAKSQQTIQSSLAGRKVRDAMVQQFPVITPGTSLQELLDQHIARDFQRAFVVMLGNQFYGLITASDIRKVPPEQRASTPVTMAMTRPEQVISVRPDDPLEAALYKLAGNRIHQLVVLDGGQPMGLITREGVLSVMELTDLFVKPEAR